jgi:hypothetical protein
MKAIEQKQIQLRSRWRTFKNDVFRQSSKAARLKIRLDKLGAPGPVPVNPSFSLDAWYERILEVMEGGVIPVEFIAYPQHPRLELLIRFCHRLEAPTSLRTEGTGLDRRVADALVDAGLQQLWLLIEQPATIPDTFIAIEQLKASRSDRKSPLKIGVEALFVASWARELPGIFRASRLAGIESVRLLAPYQGPVWQQDQQDRQAVMLDIMALDRPPFNATAPGLKEALEQMQEALPGTPRSSGFCTLGSQVELLPDHSIRCCPFQKGAAITGLPSKVLAEHRTAIRACNRECWHEDYRTGKG